MRMVAIMVAAVLGAALVAQGALRGEAAEKVKARNPKQTGVTKIDALSWKMKVQEGKKGAGLKANAKDGAKGKSGYDYSHRLQR